MVELRYSCRGMGWLQYSWRGIGGLRYSWRGRKASVQLGKIGVLWFGSARLGRFGSVAQDGSAAIWLARAGSAAVWYARDGSASVR